MVFAQKSQQLEMEQGHLAAVRDAGRCGSTQHSDLPQPSSADGRGEEWDER